MNKYLLPVDDGQIYILSVSAKDFEQAKDKFIDEFADAFEYPNNGDWEEVQDWLAEHNIYIGDIYDIEEF